MTTFRLPVILAVAMWLAFMVGCGPNTSDFATFMGETLPPTVNVLKMDGNWGADPWRCWEISPADSDLMRALVARWKLTPDAQAFHGVASGNHIYCRYEDLTESYSGSADSYRAVGIDVTRNVLLVYFYNG